MMRVENKLNMERVNALGIEPNAYSNNPIRHADNKVETQSATKVIFPEPYQNAVGHYGKTEFKRPEPPKPPPPPQPTFDLKSLLPMLLSGGNFGEMLKPLLSMFGGGNMDLTKIMDLFKLNKKSKPAKKEEPETSKFDEFVIIDD